MTEAGETDDDTPPEPFDLDDEDESAPPAPTWLGVIGQMIAALLVVVAIIAFFIGAAAALRRLLPLWTRPGSGNLPREGEDLVDARVPEGDLHPVVDRGARSSKRLTPLVSAPASGSCKSVRPLDHSSGMPPAVQPAEEAQNGLDESGTQESGSPHVDARSGARDAQRSGHHDLRLRERRVESGRPHGTAHPHACSHTHTHTDAHAVADPEPGSDSEPHGQSHRIAKPWPNAKP